MSFECEVEQLRCGCETSQTYAQRQSAVFNDMLLWNYDSNLAGRRIMRHFEVEKVFWRNEKSQVTAAMK